MHSCRTIFRELALLVHRAYFYADDPHLLPSPERSCLLILKRCVSDLKRVFPRLTPDDSLVDLVSIYLTTRHRELHDDPKASNSDPRVAGDRDFQSVRGPR